MTTANEEERESLHEDVTRRRYGFIQISSQINLNFAGIDQ